MNKHILTADGKLYHCDVNEQELYHYGVPGMKWGQRKARPVSIGGRRGMRQQQSSSSPVSSKAKAQARKSRAKKALKIGAARIRAEFEQAAIRNAAEMAKLPGVISSSYVR